MNRRFLLTTAGAALMTSGLWTAAFAQDTAAADAEAPAATEIKDMVLGNADAKVEVIEYASFTCPHCAAFHANVWPQIKENYIDTGKIKFVYREVYFDRYGLWGSMIARCGGEMRFFGIAGMLYEGQREWTAGEPAQIAANLRNIGKVAGLDDATLDACMNDATTAESLVAWYQKNAEADKIEGTPSFIINGEKYSNMSYEDFAKILDEKLAAAN